MGTRNSTFVQIDGEYKIAQYCQFDGYPEGQGLGILNFLKRSDIKELKEKIKNVSEIKPYELKKLWENAGHNGNSQWVNLSVSDKFKQDNPHLHRGCGGYELLDLIYEGKANSVSLDLNFPSSSLWCEWCYVLDFDTGKFEIYKGFNKIPLNEKERFFDLEPDPSTEYKQVKHLISFDLYNLPDEDQFINEINHLISDY